MIVALAALVGAALAALTYVGFERLGRRGIAPMACRAVAWAALGVLLVNVSCPGAAVRESPVVLLDASLSLGGAGGRWAEARAIADSLGDVRPFGDPAHPAITDSTPRYGRSSLGPALVAAAASGRPVIVVTDGEVDDRAELAPDLLARAGVRVVPRRPLDDVAIVAVDAPDRAVQGDTIDLIADVRVIGAPPDSVSLVVLDGAATLGRQRVRVADGSSRARFRLPTAALSPGTRLLRIRRDGSADGEPATDERLHRLELAATPGVVLLAAPGDWDARFLYRAVREVSGVPLRGFVRVQPDRWRDMRDLSPASDAEVRRAAAEADLLILKGATGNLAQGSRARGVLFWPSGEGGQTVLAGDWYLAAGASSPLAGALAGQPLDSFPPATAVMAIEAPADAWVGLTSQEGRRGAVRPVVMGRTAGGRREVTVAADGLFRWSFRGGASEQAYRSLVGGIVTWLLGGADPARGVARPLRGVVQQGRPIVFGWLADGSPRPVVVRWNGAAPRADTLRFDGAGRATAWLPPGEWRYTLDGGGEGLVAVERYSDEFVPRAVVLQEQPPADAVLPRRIAARDLLWLFGLAVLGLAGEWLFRRRLGLR